MIDYILKASRDQNRIITIIYQKGNVITKRNIRVLSIDGDTIKAYCYLRNSIRIFRRKNILAAEFYNPKISTIQKHS
ncbi:MAG TPA: hypothetical protein GXX37_02055 [Clostridiaceae bacterium]|nr:hypothetical protein [Clostridiaceae bacterium]